MNRDDDTANLAASNDAEDAPAPGDPVGRVNMPDEPEKAYVSDAYVDAGHSPEPAKPANLMREKVLFGVLTVVLMIFALIVILQGVFEQRMPV